MQQRGLSGLAAIAMGLAHSAKFQAGNDICSDASGPAGRGPLR
jgi:hypothetical protein